MKRLALISLIIGTALALVPVASSMVLDGGSGGGGGLAAAPGGVDPATQAVVLRSQGLADYYGANGVTLHPDVLGGDGGASVAPASGSGDSFDWSPVLAATLTGMLLLAAAATMTTRRRHRLSY
jgi:hypothetical protein